MLDEKPSLQQLLALARQRRLWPEVDCQDKSTLLPTTLSPVMEAPQSSEAEVELQLRTVELREQIAQALGSKQAAVQPMLDELEALFAAGPALDLDAAWAALDELEDQLEALSR
ncbi:MAG: hypothetical protein JNM83_28550 [Myxococcales bacterium]|nr:hypothetical protein [Myxococcales bacterium]